MSEAKVIETKQKSICKGPFGTYKTFEGKKDFDKYYLEVSEKEVFKDSGEKDEEGNRLGISEKKLIIKKIDIHEFLESQRDTVGVESYMRSLALQGENIDDYHTVVDDKIQDFSQMPDNLADVMTAGDKAKAAFAKLDPALKGSHTTIEGFLNGLTQETIDSYIKGRVEALTPKTAVKEGE